MGNSFFLSCMETQIRKKAAMKLGGTLLMNAVGNSTFIN